MLDKIRWDTERGIPDHRAPIAAVLRVSIVICCYNSRSRLRKTLECLSRQCDVGFSDWEIVLVDNASTDDTSRVAQDLWREFGAPCEMRVVKEPKAGLIHARFAGIAAARFEILSFVDDDNWICPAWCATILRLMAADPHLGVIGSRNEAAFDSGQSVPLWFAPVQHGYAVGRQAPASGPPPQRMPRFFGAGLTVRRKGMRDILEAGFVPVLTGRSGDRLMAGDDSELCYALGIRGWKFWYEESLLLHHYMPPGRLTHAYALRLWFGLGYAAAIEDIYTETLPPVSLRERIKHWPVMRWFAALRGWLHHEAASFLSPGGSLKSQQRAIRAKYFRGRIAGLIDKPRYVRAVTAQIARMKAAGPLAPIEDQAV
ncbi:MAG TPA: glycosyltransferase [Rhizomicrobium sp.]|nr:glycosyltransferase [Rhizomicrobium sp.]